MTIHHRFATSRPGTAYAMTLTICAVAATTAVSGLAIRAASADRGERVGDLAEARLLAQSGIEATLQRIADDADWRQTFGNRLIDSVTLGGDTIQIAVFDPADNNLRNDDTDGYRVVSRGTVGDAAATLRVDIAATVSEYRQLVVAAKPVAYWPFDESAFTTVAKPIVGSQNGGYSLSTVPGTMTGYDGLPAAYVNDWNEYGFVPHHDALLLDSGTVMCHFYCAWNVSGDQTIFAKNIAGDHGPGSLHIYLSQDQVIVRLENTAGYINLNLGKIDFGAWHHVAVSFGSSGLFGYLDGSVKDKRSSFKTGMGPGAGGSGNTHPIQLGVWYDGSVFRNSLFGAVRDLVFFNRQLDETEILGFLQPTTEHRIDPESWAWMMD